MELFHFLMGYLGMVASVLFVVLFGETPMFRKTPVSFCHWCITVAPIQGFEWILHKCCGVYGGRFMLWMEDICCNRRNPVMQVFYLLIWGGCYYLFLTHLFPMLPGKYIGDYHRYTGSLAAFSCLWFFYLSSVTDPGTVTEENCRSLVSHFPYDNAIFPVEKICVTCGFVKPARSKHCSACRRCVARFDHHCGWINNCVGLNNHRYFIGFLAANLLVAVYGLTAICLTIFGDIEDVLWHPIMHPRHQEVVYLGRSPSILFEWLMIRHPILIILLFVSFALGLLMIGFLGFHLYLISSGKTTNEGFKWADLSRVLEEKRTENPSARGWFLWNKQRPKIVLPKNVYNKGFRANFYEILFPHSILNGSGGRQLNQKSIQREKKE